ncbi:ATP-dependent DNA helicase [Trichonephila clavipes]|nr:ATP-dependent DNA helicase [Trichonephila clavipes]
MYRDRALIVGIEKDVSWRRKLIFSQTQNHIALAIASSGIAATLLDGGCTAHSALKEPLNVHTNPDAMCNIKKHSGMAEVLRKCKIIIWDECTMAHKHSLEALDRTLKDFRMIR